MTGPRRPYSSMGQEGFTLLELTAALTVLVMLAAGLAASLVVGYRANQYTRERDIARAAVHTQMEQVKSWSNYDNLVDAFDGTTFEVIELPEVEGSPAGEVLIDDANPDLLSVRVTVSWTGRGGGIESYELNTRIANTNP